jgi:hypothetical protein
MAAGWGEGGDLFLLFICNYFYLKGFIDKLCTYSIDSGKKKVPVPIYTKPGIFRISGQAIMPYTVPGTEYPTG